MITKFKPNLIPNNPKDGTFDLPTTILTNGGMHKYNVFYKKDGCRLHLGLDQNILTRSLKQPKSVLVINRFKKLNELCLKLNIAIDGEFYMHGLKFNEIFRFFSNTDVTRSEVVEKYKKLQNKDAQFFAKEYSGRSIEHLTTLHQELKFWLFDGIILDRPDLVRFEDRMKEIISRLSNYDLSNMYITLPESIEIDQLAQLNGNYELALAMGFEGLVLTHKDHEYKYGRNSLKQGTLLKMKDDKLEYDGIIIDIIEATEIRDGVEKSINELGRSVTSKKKEDRIPSGLAKGFVVEFDGKTFPVGLSGFNNEAKKELLQNKDQYIGRHFKYTGMSPVKDFPRHAYFDCWRDEK
tara:strand:+ start:4966 stop:6018 length:1053 start_codon:yes stop_codon:yes gene_type:complete